MREEHFEVGIPEPEFKEYLKEIKSFFDEVDNIVKVQNHIHKFRGTQQLLDLIHHSADMVNVHACFACEDGQWYLAGAKTKQDVLNLNKVAKTFSRVYRHHANDYKAYEMMIE